MFCQKCRASMPVVDQSMVSCSFCERDLSGEATGTAICEECADSRLLCQGCGAELRLGDFSGVFVCGANARLGRSDERKIVALLIKHEKRNRKLEGKGV